MWKNMCVVTLFGGGSIEKGAVKIGVDDLCLGDVQAFNL
jgi:hypothetical protein